MNAVNTVTAKVFQSAALPVIRTLNLDTSLPFLALHGTFLSVNINCIAPYVDWWIKSHTAFKLLFKQYTTEELKKGPETNLEFESIMFYQIH